MLEAIELSKKYDSGPPALDSLNLKVESGEIFCLLGANGAGKTTPINLVLNFIQPSSGLAKIVFRALVVLLMALIFSFLALVLIGVDLLEGSTLTGLALWLGIVVAYGGFWFGLAVAVNSLGKNSSTNAVMRASLWLLLVVLVPTGVNLMVKSLHPVPSRAEFILASREASLEAEVEKAELLSTYYDDHPEFLTEEERSEEDVQDLEFDTTQWVMEMKVEAAVQPVQDRYEQQLEKQQVQVNRLRFISPAIVTQQALNEIAGTRLGRYRHFAAVVDAFHQGWRDYFVPKILDGYKMTIADFDEIPKFVYTEEPPGRMVRQVLQDLLGLLIPGLVIFGLGLLRVQRYPVSG